MRIWVALLIVMGFFPLQALCGTPFTIVGTTTPCANTSIEFEVKLSTEPSGVTFTWYKNGQHVTSISTPNSVNDVLVIDSYSTGDVITCQGVDAEGNQYTSNALTITVASQQDFTVQVGTNAVGPDKYNLCAGQSITFIAIPNLTASTFQWQMNGITQSATGSTFTTTVVSVAQLQSVTVTTTAASGCVVGQPATGYASSIPFIINPVTFPAVTVTQSTTPVLEGSPVTFTATPSGQGNFPVYQWQLNGTTVTGVTGNTYTPTISSGSDLQSVSVSMSSSGTCPQNAAVATTSFQLVSSDWENQNYVRVQDILVAAVSNWIAIDQMPIGQKREKTTYLDGLGRPIQKLDKSGGLVAGTATDLVQPITYDPAGRMAQHFLPYTTADNPGKFKSANVLTEQATFVTNKFGEPSGAPTYSQITYDNSPLNRVMQTLAPGSSWGGNNVGPAYSYDFNTLAENVHIWSLDYTASAIPATTTTAVYTTGSLLKNSTTDEKGNQVIYYTNLYEDTILKKVQLADPGSLSAQHAGWACTYYVYDDLNQLKFILTPKLVDYLDNNGWVLSQQLMNDLCFVYTYDAKGRPISKKQPGIGETDIVYDQRYRPVFIQDAKGQSNNQWQSVVYDALDRVTSTGMLQATISPVSLQSNVDANTGNITVSNNSGITANLIVTGQQGGVSQYLASSSIVFQANFQSDAGGTFTAFINPNLGPAVSEVVAVADNPVPPGNTLVLLTQTFYDDYSHATKSYTTADNSLFDPSTNQQALPLPSTYDLQNRGRAIVSRVKVITNPADLTQGNWLETDSYYDNQGRVVQTQNDNNLGGTDIVTNRYDFAGKLWGTCVKHMAGSPTQFTVVSRNAYDNLGRLTDIAKNFNSSFFKDLVTYSYDEYGKLISKVLAPGYTGSGKSAMETLNYDYNIQGWLTGINKAYALDQNVYDQWNAFFGIYLGYDNRDNQFAAAQLNGSITGGIWKSQGDNSMRKYDYSYDRMGRLTSAAFNQRSTPADSWSNSTVDFSETISYTDASGVNDKNGNIQSLTRMGIVPGINGGIAIDNLLYSYGTSADPNVNWLSRVDERASFTGNGQLGDFQNGTNAAGTNDYNYDLNGNLSQDQNKGITDANGIAYNYMNKPVTVTIAGKSTITYVYDATGAKLSKSVTNLAVTPNTTTTTVYDDEFVYQDNVLQYVLHDEGRLKLITPIATPQVQLNAGTSGVSNVLSGRQGVFEYFIKDQLSNVRMVLTEESQTEVYTATMETSSASDPNLGTDEAKLFGQVDPGTGAPTPDNEVNLTRMGTPQIWSGNTSAQVSHLSAALAGQTIGPNMLLKVSAGDIINSGVQYFYYTNDPTGPSSYNGSDVVTSVMAALLGNHLSPLAEGNNSLISSNLGAPTSNLSSFINSYYNLSNQAPKAFLNIIFFDEQFNFVQPDPNAPGVGTNLTQVSSPNDQNASIIMGQKAPKNGWVYIYISNESNQDVYFDNLNISQVHGNISEENHYYPFGLKIAGICTVAFNKLPNKYRYQSYYSEEEENMQWNEFDLRNYDPQIGRWTGVDPDDQFASPYVGMGNDPVNNVDPDGGDLQAGVSWGGIIGGSLGALAGGTSLYFIARNNHWNQFSSILLGAGGALAGSGLGYATGQWIDQPVGFEGVGWGNSLIAFYKGLFGDVSENFVKANLFSSETSDIRNNGAVIPSIWSGLNIDLSGIFSGFHPNITPDVYDAGEKILVDIVFQSNKPDIDFNKTNKNKLNEMVNKIIRTLKENKSESFELSGGTDAKDLDSGVGDTKNKYTYEQLVQDRIQAVKNYINQFTNNKKILRRVYDNGNIIRTGAMVEGKIIH